jgi:hypothetical protein
MRKIRRDHHPSRFTALFGLVGALLWLVSGMFLAWAFETDVGPNDWVQMHAAKLEAGVGIGLAGIGTLFICFAALIFVLSRGPRGS